MPTTNYFDAPIPQPGLYSSITITAWWNSPRFGYQTTCYKGLKDELIAAGIAPAEAFAGMGISCTRSGKFRSGKIFQIRITRAGAGSDFWHVRLRHESWNPPYESEAAKCAVGNMETWTYSSDSHQQNQVVTDASNLFKLGRCKQTTKEPVPTDANENFPSSREIQEQITKIIGGPIGICKVLARNIRDDLSRLQVAMLKEDKQDIGLHLSKAIERSIALMDRLSSQ